MNINKELNENYGRETVQKVVEYIGNDKKKFSKLMELFFGDNIMTTQRTSWALSISAEKNPSLLSPYLDKMISIMEYNHNDTITRNTLRTIQFIDIPEQYLGRLFELCYQFVLNPKAAIAIKAFSMTVLYNICVKEPELKNEVILAIEMQKPYQSPGVKSRAIKVLKQLENID